MNLKTATIIFLVLLSCYLTFCVVALAYELKNIKECLSIHLTQSSNEELKKNFSKLSADCATLREEVSRLSDDYTALSFKTLMMVKLYAELKVMLGESIKTLATSLITQIAKVAESHSALATVTSQAFDKIIWQIKTIKEDILDIIIKPIMDSKKPWMLLKIPTSKEPYFIVYYVRKIDKEKKEYDLLFGDLDMFKKPKTNTYIRARGSWEKWSIIEFDVVVEGKIVTYRKDFPRGNILERINDPEINRLQNPESIVFSEIIKAIIKQETEK
ncbi:MAG: hypothetical protein UT05_C0006G0025 [Parcubacteria group bacterium GW2011_GWF2_38_76]|nr:MAG: hypothetical protein UT05_C0006G0025 [Parcubacteria group bacterium GW2011_GWF2_38_76]HBM45874.1 hypothetical protein [Patescibacteria group bacterium]